MKIPVLLLLSLLLANGCSTSTPPQRPNILFIAIDDMNDWTTLFDPANPIRTPNLERLAERGTFSRAPTAPPRDAIRRGPRS